MFQKHLVFIVLLITCSSVLTQDEEDTCTMRETGSRGICRRVSNCPGADERIKNGVRPTVCGFYQLTEPIICCQDSSEANDNLFPTNFNSNHEEASNTNVNTRISDQKCEEYNKPVTSVVQVLPLVSDVQPIPIKIPKCDYNSVPLIVGGKPAEPGEFPFMAAVGFNTSYEPWRCGGTLISDRYVVTAAHCTFTRDAGQPSVVRLGELDLSSDNDGTQYKDYPISRIIIHPGYNYPQKYNDIALLQTRERITFSNFIRPACLNLNRNLNSGEALATGWGKTDFAGESSDQLMKVALHIFKNDRCKTTFPANNKELPRGVDDTMLCGGDLEGGKDTCYGDSGGPLVVTKKGNMCQFYLVGVTSFGKLCGKRNTPAIYTRVSEYVDWIERNVW